MSFTLYKTGDSTNPVGSCSVSNNNLRVTQKECTDVGGTFTSQAGSGVTFLRVITVDEGTTESLGTTENTALSGIEGVTHSLVSGVHTYTLSDDVYLAVGGTLNHNTENSRIVSNISYPTGNTVNSGAYRRCAFLVLPSGTYNFGVEKGVTGSGVYTDGVGLEFNGTMVFINGGGHSNVTNKAQLAPGQNFGVFGTFNGNGGRILGSANWSAGSGANFNSTRDCKFLVNSTQLLASKITNGVTFNSPAFTFEGGVLSINQSTAITLEVSRNAASIGYRNESTLAISGTAPGTNDADATYSTVRNISMEGNDIDVGIYSNTFSTEPEKPGHGTRYQNIAQGSALNINGSSIGGDSVRNTNSYILGTQRIASNLMSLSDGSGQRGIILMRDTNRFANLTVDVVGGTQKTPLSTTYPDFDDDSQFEYRGTVAGGDITTWSTRGGYAAGTLIPARGDTEVVLYTFSSDWVSNVRRPIGSNNEGIWARDIRGATDDITSSTLDQFTFHIWSYENNYVSHTGVVSGIDDYLIEEALVVDPAVTLSRAGAVRLEESTKGDALTYTTGQIDLTAAITLDELYDIIKLRKELDVSDEALPSLSSMIISGDGEEIDLLAITQNFTGSGVLSAGANHKKVVHNTRLDLSDFTLAGLELSATDLTLSGTSLTVPAGCKLTGTVTKNEATTITVEANADVSELILAGTGTYTLVGATDSDVSASSTSTIINSFTHNVVIDTSAVSETTFYRVLTGSTLATLTDSGTFGSVTGATDSHTISLDSTSITSLGLGDSLVVVATSTDGLDVRHVTTLQDTTDNITINRNPAYNSGATANAGVVGTIDSPVTAYTITVNGGISEGSANTNKTFNSLRSTQNYCDFIAFLGLDGSIVNSSSISTLLHADTVELATVRVGSTGSTDAVSFQGLFVDSGSISDILTAGAFTGTGTIGLAVAGSNEVDYAAVRSTVKEVVEEPLKKASRFIPLNDSDF